MNSSSNLMPVITEKTMRMAKVRSFTFYVPMEMNKLDIKKMIENGYSVTVIKVRTINSKRGTKKNVRGQVQKIKSQKKAIVVLKEGDKIDLFEEEKKKAKKKTKKTKEAAK